jgi:hypothetical protein
MDGDADISPRTAATLLTAVVLLGIGLYALSVFVDYKSADPLYDAENMSTHTPSSLMETQDLWKKKEPAVSEGPQAQGGRRAATSNPVSP